MPAATCGDTLSSVTPACSAARTSWPISPWLSRNGTPASTSKSARSVGGIAGSSAGTRTYAGEGLLGFAWAFLNAGAHAVIAGLWDVSDVSTSQLMDRLYRSEGQ